MAVQEKEEKDPPPEKTIGPGKKEYRAGVQVQVFNRISHNSIEGGEERRLLKKTWR